MEPAYTFVSPLSSCAYLPDQISQLRYVVVPELAPADYMHCMREGWRRFGAVVFRPECPSCQQCQSLRVPVAAFSATESQRRAWRKNAGDVQIRVGTPSLSRERIDLFLDFHRHKQDVQGWPDRGEEDLEQMLQNPFPTEEWSYYVGERLIGVGYVDALPAGLSAIYFYYDPAERHRSLGTFNVVSLIDAARERGLPHVYLGYYVEGCRSLEYKARFRPNERLRGGRWEPFLP